MQFMATSASGSTTEADQASTMSTDAIQHRRLTIEKVQSALLIWLDSSIDRNSEDYQKTLKQLRRTMNNVMTFTDSDECIEFIRTINDNKVCMIIPGFLGQHTVPHIHNMSQVDSVFIFCSNDKRHKQWAQGWPKIKGVSTDVTSICEALKQAVQQCEQNSMPLTFLTPNTKLDQLDPSFMYTLILKEILINMDYDEQHLKEYADFCRAVFADNEEELTNVDKFECQYSSETPIWWYTCQCFLYPMLNRALRQLDGDIIIRMGFYIADLHRNIDELHTTQLGDQYRPAPLTVYRGQGLSKKDFEHLCNTKGGLMAFNNFLSTSKIREVSLSFAQYAATNLDLVGILFVMNIDPAQSTTPFASIREVSYFQTEEEVLFSMNTVFRICNIESMAAKSSLFEVNLTLTSDDDEELSTLTYSIRDEIPPCEGGWKPLALVMEKMGQFDKAEQMYQALLEQTPHGLGNESLYHALGRIKFQQGKYDEAITFHDKAIQIYRESYSLTSSYLFEVYNNIGLAHSAAGDNLTALSYFEKAIGLRQQSLPPDHPDLANTYHHMGNAYYRMDDYSQALSFHEQALAIWHPVLPSHHPDLAMCYSDIGLVHESMSDYSRAYSYFERAIEVAQHSLPSNHPDLLKYREQLQRVKKKL